MRRFKKLLVGGVLAFFVATTAHAILPIAGAVAWLGTTIAANAGIATAIEASIYAHVGAFAIYEIFFAKKGADGKPEGTPAIAVKLNPSAARANPDPAKFNDPAAGSRDVTPKSSIASVPGEFNDPADNGTGGGSYFQKQIMSTGQWIYGGSATGVLSQYLAADYCVGGYFTGCRVDSCNTQSNGSIDCASWAKPGTASCNISNTQGECMLGRFTASKTIGSPPVSCPKGSYSVGGGVCKPYDGGSPGCVQGYTLQSDGSCKLTDADQVKKPDTHPCEILRTPSGLSVDKANPNCAGLNVQGNSISPTADTSVSINADGSVSISNPSGQTTLQLGAPNSDGSMPVTGASRSGNPGSYVPGSSTSPSACGGPGQPPCSGTGGSTVGSGGGMVSVDDSGMAGKSADMTAGNNALDQHANDKKGLFEKAKDSVVAPTWGWQMPVTAAACQSLEIGSFGPLHFKVDWCKYLPLMQQAISFMAYCFTALFLFQLVFGASRSENK